MENHEYSVGLDIGTTKIVAIVGRKDQHGKIEIVGKGWARSVGVSKGIVNNISQTINSIRTAIEEAEKTAKISIKKVTVGIAGKHIRSLQHSDYIMRENPEKFITEEDIEELKNQVKKIIMQPGEEIIHVLPQEYKIDSEGDIKDPIGMHGKRLEANFHVVVGQMGSIKNLVRCVKEAGLEMEALTLEPIASAEAVLSDEEREAGVAIVDIGGGTTDIAIFKDNIIRHTCVIPYGGNIITQDIKEECSIIESYAEQLKVKYGSSIPNMEKENTYIKIPGIHGREEKEISLKMLSQIINSRVEEILQMVNTELEAYGAQEKKKYLIAGIVLSGGGSNLKHLRQLSAQLTGFETRIGVANEFISNDNNELLKGPEYATAVGLLMESINVKERLFEEKEIIEEEEEKIVEIKKEEGKEPKKIKKIEKVEKNKESSKKTKKIFSKFLTWQDSIVKGMDKFFQDTE